jgi:hypothetical protein
VVALFIVLSWGRLAGFFGCSEKSSLSAIQHTTLTQYDTAIPAKKLAFQCITIDFRVDYRYCHVMTGGRQ